MISRMLQTLGTPSALRGRFAGNALKLFAANAVAQALSFAAYPLLTRIYSPDQMGVLSVVLFAVMILSPLSTLRYEMALPLCCSESAAASVLVLCFAAVGTTVGTMTVVLLAVPASVFDAISPAAPYRLFVPLGLLAFGCYNVLLYEASRADRYTEISRSRVSQAVFGPLIQIALGIAGAGIPGLLSGFVIGLSSGTLGLARTLRITTGSLWSRASGASVLAAARQYARFPLFSSWAGVLLTGSMNMGNVVFPTLYGATVGGLLFLGDRVLMQPLRVSGNSLQQVFVGEGGKLLGDHPGRFHKLFVRAIAVQAAIAALWLGAIAASARFVLPVVFGPSWGAASPYMNFMLFGYFPVAVAMPVTHTLLLMRRQRLAATLDVLRFSALAAAIAISFRRHDTALQGVLAYSLTQGAAQLAILAVIYAKVRGLSPRAAHAPRTA